MTPMNVSPLKKMPCLYHQAKEAQQASSQFLKAVERALSTHQNVKNTIALMDINLLRGRSAAMRPFIAV